MKKKYLSYIFTIFFLFGCSHTTNKENNSPIHRYNEYVAVLSKESYENLLKKYWARSFASESLSLLLDKSEKNMLDRNSVIFSINFPKDMRSIVFQKKTVNNKTACVLVAGISEEKTPMTFNITYTMEDKNWLIQEVHATFLKESDSYPNKPDCSSVTPQNITNKVRSCE